MKKGIILPSFIPFFRKIETVGRFLPPSSHSMILSNKMNKVKDQFESKIGSWCPFELEKLNNTDKYKYGRCCIHFQMC